MSRRLAAFVSVGLLALAACGDGGSKPKPPTYQLSGTITRAWGGALAGVAVDLGGGATGTVTTDGSGRFSFPSLSDGSYTVTPRLAGWAFTPAAPTVVVSGADETQDFTADGAHTIGGTVSGSVQGGVSIALTGGGVVKPAVTSAPGTGTYLFTGIPNGTYTLTPTLSGHTFTPASPSVVVNGAGATQDFVGAAALRIAGALRWGPDPLAGATVRLTGARAALTTTDAAGAYAFEGLAAGQTYTVTPATFGFQALPASRSYTLAGSVTDADFAADAVGTPARTLHGTLSYAGGLSGPVYVTVSGPFGPGSPMGGTGLAAEQAPWSGRAFTVRNVQAMGFVRVRAWMDTLGLGRFVTGVDPAVTFDFDTASGAADLGDHALVDPAAPAVDSPVALGQVVAGDGAAVVIFDPPRDVSGDLVADAFRVYWNDAATVDAAHTLGTIDVKAGSDFAVVHGLSNGTPYWFAVEARLGGAPLPGQQAASAAPVTPAPAAGTATISGTVGHPAAAAPSALYVVAQSGQKGPGAGIWWQRIANPAGTQTDYTLLAPPGTYAIFAFLDAGDDGAVALGEPARFPDQVTSFFTAAAGPNAGPTIALPGGNAAPSLATARWATASSQGAAFDLAVASAGKLPLAAAVSGPGLRGPLDLPLRADSGGVGVTLGASFDPAPIFPVTGDAYALAVTYADGSTETFQRAVTGSFGGPPGVVTPPDGAADVELVPTFQWSAPPGASGSWGWVLELSTQAGDQPVWGTFLPGTQTSVVYDADGLALTPELAPLTGHAWNVIAIDADGNRAGSGATFTTGAGVLPLYDPLAGPTLDGARWQTPQYERTVEGGRLVLGVQADDMQARSLQGTTYTNALTVPPGGRRVTALGATVTVPAATAARSGAAAVIGGIRLTYQAAADRGRPAPFAANDMLIAALELFDDGNGLMLRRRFYHCDDAGCAVLSRSGIVATDPPGFVEAGVDAVASAAYDAAYTLGLSLDEATGVFTWTVQGGAFGTPVSGTADPSAWVTGVGMALASTTDGFLQAQLYARASDDAGGSSGRIRPAFDDVAAGFDGAAAAPFDDFGAGFLDPSRWGAVDSDVWQAAGSLHLSSALTTAAAGGGVETTVVSAMYPGSFLAWQAVIAITGDELGPTPDSGNRGGLIGAFYNDGTAGGGAIGDVRASVNLSTAGAGWVITRCPNAACSGASGSGGALTASPAHPLGLGTVHTLGVRWDPVTRLFTFTLDDAAPVVVDPAMVLPGAPVVDPAPRFPVHLLFSTTAIGSAAGAGSSSRAEVTFANVRGVTR